MDALMRKKSAYEIERLMKRVSRESIRVLEQFKAMAMALEPGQERYQCFLSALPKVDELRGILNRMSREREYEVIHHLNGYTVKRVR